MTAPWKILRQDLERQPEREQMQAPLGKSQHPDQARALGNSSQAAGVCRPGPGQGREKKPLFLSRRPQLSHSASWTVRAHVRPEATEPRFQKENSKANISGFLGSPRPPAVKPRSFHAPDLCFPNAHLWSPHPEPGILPTVPYPNPTRCSASSVLPPPRSPL